MLVQLGLIDPAVLPVSGAESTYKARDQHSRPSNELIRRVAQRTGGGPT